MNLRKTITVLFMAACLLSLWGCGNTQPLTEAELQQANEAFYWLDEEAMAVNEITCFFMCHYSTPAEIDLGEFLCYCPVSVDLTVEDIEEYQKVLTAAGVPNPQAFPTPEDYIVPVHRYRAAEISALLKKYVGITVEELDHQENIVYLEEYDSYYNFTSDFGPVIFECVGGEKTDTTVRLWSAQKENGMVDVLTLVKDGDVWHIRSFLEENAR